jgi:amino acid transporter
MLTLVSLLDRILGRRLASWEAEGERFGPAAGVPILGLDGLSSAAYGPEAALSVLIPVGLAGLVYIGPITFAVLALLAILYFSYRQTIEAYPNGGGSYVVAKENLGTMPGLIAAAALLIDYVLNVAVGISAGIGALVSAVPALHRHVLALCLLTLAALALLNLRGMRESGVAFGVPTFAFVATLAVVIVIGIIKTIAGHGHPAAVIAPPHPIAATAAVSVWLLLRSFASGCTAMTGVEAVSNAVPAFTEPRVRNAQRTLTAIVVILAALLGGIAFLSRAYGIMSMDQAKPGYQSILSSLVAAVTGRGALYYVTICSVLAVLSFSANTSFAGFPRLCRLVAEDGYLPKSFANVGRRLVYSAGIIVLTVLSAVLLIVFGGITDRLIPLFAVGAFAAFTLSQAGMVVHWHRTRGPGHRTSRAINAVGAIATGAALVIIVVAKFVEGAWISILLIPASLFVFTSVRKHYLAVAAKIHEDRPFDGTGMTGPPVVVLPVVSWNTVTEKALRFALTISPDIVALHIAVDDARRKHLEDDWKKFVEQPVRSLGLPIPRLVVLESPYRRLLKPIIDYVDDLRGRSDKTVAVIIPDLVERHWFEYTLHNHRGDVLRTLLLLRGLDKVVVVSVPWYFDEGPH